MEKFKSYRIEKLKVEFYGIVGELEIKRDIVITGNELDIFENKLLTCKSEEDAAGLILGAIRRYKVKLKDTGECIERVMETPSVENEDVNKEEQVIVESNILLDQVTQPGTLSDQDENVNGERVIVEPDVLQPEFLSHVNDNGEQVIVEPDVLQPEFLSHINMEQMILEADFLFYTGVTRDIEPLDQTLNEIYGLQQKMNSAVELLKTQSNALKQKLANNGTLLEQFGRAANVEENEFGMQMFENVGMMEDHDH